MFIKRSYLLKSPPTVKSLSRKYILFKQIRPQLDPGVSYTVTPETERPPRLCSLPAPLSGVTVKRWFSRSCRTIKPFLFAEFILMKATGGLLNPRVKCESLESRVNAILIQIRTVWS